jgi:hypothetical protein
MKKVLVISFSQSGQLTQIVDNFLIPFKGVEIDNVLIEPVNTFPFPWDTKSFYDAMPETVLEEEIEINPLQFKHAEYDLIVFGYQPWFLSPSMPAMAVLKDKEFGKRIKGKPIVTIIGARNMWLNSQESVKALIKNAGGNLVANIPLVDKAFNLIGAITIVYWLSNGKKDRKWGVFPLPGISEKDINESSLFGGQVIKALQNDSFNDLQKNILKLNKIHINTSILFIESRAKTLFKIWANIIKKKGVTLEKRKLWLTIFRFYLHFALFALSPIILTIYTVMFRPFLFTQIRRKKEYFCSVNLIKNG